MDWACKRIHSEQVAVHSLGGVAAGPDLSSSYECCFATTVSSRLEAAECGAVA